jgi:cell wall-associated NlpC family hydrolase
VNPWFSTPERIARLREVAKSWQGTPYVQSGAVKGSGASCHRLAGAVLAEAGFPIPEVPERGGIRMAQYREAMKEWLEGHCESFMPVKLDELRPGDVLLCQIGIGHIALFLGGQGEEVLQVLRNVQTHCVSFNDPQARKYVLCAYRPIEPQE